MQFNNNNKKNNGFKNGAIQRLRHAVVWFNNNNNGVSIHKAGVAVCNESPNNESRFISA